LGFSELIFSFESHLTSLQKIGGVTTLAWQHAIWFGETPHRID
jgi:hypothetical protein